MAQFVEEGFRKFRFAVVDERVQNRISKPTQRGIGFDAFHGNVAAFGLEAPGVIARSAFGKIAAVFKAADDWIPPRLRLE